jgi:hypothetical protein
MDLPAGFELRAPTADDADSVAHVLIADAWQTVLDADFLRDEWSRVGFDLGRTVHRCPYSNVTLRSPKSVSLGSLTG